MVDKCKTFNLSEEYFNINLFLYWEFIELNELNHRCQIAKEKVFVPFLGSRFGFSREINSIPILVIIQGKEQQGLQYSLKAPINSMLICKLVFSTTKGNAMRNLKIVVAVGLLAVLTSCGATKQTAASKEPGTRGRVNTETPRAVNQSTESRQEAARRTAAAGLNTDSEALNEARMSEMFTALNMKQDQIDRFQSEWRTSMKSWKRNNRNQAMNNYERIERQDRILRDILDESQFEAYQEWARQHAAGN